MVGYGSKRRTDIMDRFGAEPGTVEAREPRRSEGRPLVVHPMSATNGFKD